MPRIEVPSQTWVEVFDKDTSGSFKTYNFNSRVIRSASVPTHKGGVAIEGGKGIYSDIISIASDGTNNLYIYNPSMYTGYVDKDI